METGGVFEQEEEGGTEDIHRERRKILSQSLLIAFSLLPLLPPV